ncbi:MAG: TIGR00296 family protein [Candidatus Altiarchaeales archaeon]|nr:TIGR00296 family protein [Candidatus Altiarchaeales archaeon]
MRINQKQGEDVLKYARGILEHSFGKEKPAIPKTLEEVFTRKKGVFVTLKTPPEGRLRGCIGYPEPVLPFGLALERAAESAALEDPRFPPVKKEELNGLRIEVSCLTEPQLIEVEDPGKLPEKIRVGEDGLIIEYGVYKGLLLPQVAEEQGWDATQFLSQTCVKAGLKADMWLNPETRVYRFQAQIFSEEQPPKKTGKP